MNKIINLFSILFLTISVLSSCNTDEPDLFPSDLVKGAYLINYGSFGNGGASISKFDYEKNEITNKFYGNQNDGLELLSNIQYAYAYKDSIYLLGNNSDQIIVVNPLFQQSKNAIIESSISKPRFCIADGDYLYISCWGADADFSEMANTYICKFNTKTQKVEANISVPGGPEGMVITDGKLYAALNYKDSIAVLDLTASSIGYIAVPAVSSYLVKDVKGNIYATQVSTWSDYSSETGLAYINTATNNYIKTFPLDGVSSEYGSILCMNNDMTQIYLLASQYDENWNLSGTLFQFDMVSESYTEFVGGISGPKGVSVNPVDGKIYVLSAESVTEGGSLQIYDEKGTLENQFSTGISPIMCLFLN
ncbi:MAG: YncE family protein [Prolixibacteraceae bacterium]